MGKNLKGKELGIGITQRKNGKYSAKFTSRSGKRVEKYFDKLHEARKWLDEAKYQDTLGSIGSSTDMTVDAWFEYWISEIKGKTVRWTTVRNHKDRYKHNIKDAIGNMVISEVMPIHCQNVLNVMDGENYAGGTMVGVRTTMSAMFSDALENGIITSNPVTKSVKCTRKREKSERVLTSEEQKKFLDAAKNSANYLHFLFILQSGVRSSELRGLQWEDLDFQNRMIHIRRNAVYDSNHNKFIIGDVKTNSGRRDIPMTQVAYGVLVEIKRKRAEMTRISMEFADHVFLNTKGNLSSGGNYQESIKNVCKRAGIEPITMHGLRHTFATRCIESGMKPKTLQKILGHSKISITMDLYVHVTEDEKEKEMKKFEELCRMA